MRALLCVGLISICVGMVAAGDLDPPADPESTFVDLGVINDNAANARSNASSAANRALLAIEAAEGPQTPITSLPFTITQSGSYHLLSNLQMSGDGDGITVLVSDVTIDLNGFTIFGDPGATMGNGIRFPEVNGEGNSGLIVMNGNVVGWPEDGLDLSDGISNRVMDLNASLCGSDGIRPGGNAIVARCTAEQCSQDGIIAGRRSLVLNSRADRNADDGITVTSNSVIIDSIATRNDGMGFSIGSDSRGMNLIAADNGSEGIQASFGVSLQGCVSQSNDGDGFAVNSDSVVEECVAADNGGWGVDGVSNCRITDCQIQGNTDGGIDVSEESLVRGNSIYNNAILTDGPGINVTGMKNRIEDNHVADNGMGIVVTSSLNLIVRNLSTGQGVDDFSIAAANGVGPLVTFGNVATNTNPNANFDF